MNDSTKVYFGLDRPAAPEWGGRLPVALAVPGDAAMALSALGWQAAWRLLADNPTLAVERGIPLSAGSDAHRPEDVGRYFDRLPAYLASLAA